MNVKSLWQAHRLALVLSGIVLIGGGYYFYNKSNAPAATTRYVTSPASKETIVVNVSGTGQVSASSQVDAKPETSGKLLRISVKNGDVVKTGQIIAQLDASDALKAIRDAETNLETAKLSLDKLQQPADELSLTKAENSLTQAQESLVNVNNDLKQTYIDTLTTLSNAYLELPGLMSGLNTFLYGKTYAQSDQNIDWYANRVITWDSTVTNYKNDLNSAYNIANTAYTSAFDAYHALSGSPSPEETETLLQQTYDTTKLIANAVKKATTYLDFIQNVTVDHNGTIPQSMNNDQSTLRNYTGTINSELPTLLSAIDKIANAKAAIVSANRNLQELTLSLANLKAGPDVLDIRSQQITIKQREDALADAKAALSDYTLRSPFEGTITNVDSGLRAGQTISSSAVIASIITAQRIAEITLNEIDVAKVKTGQSVTLTFDALDGVTLTGKVANVAQIGTVTQGVVSYGVTIAFDIDDPRVKPGMSVSASIITQAKEDVLSVPSSAIKSNIQGTYVELLNNGVPKQQSVTTGISSDTLTEIVSGLNEGDNVITQTITTQAAAAATPTNSLIPGGFGGSTRTFTGNSRPNTGGSTPRN